MALNSSQRKYLKTLAHHLEPAVLVGHNGVSDALLSAVSQSLLAHELVKVKFNALKEGKVALTEQIAEASGAEVVGIIGNIATLYREHPEEGERRIVLPA